MSVFQIPQILGIMTLFKNCQRFRDKYFASHQQESSLPGNIPSLHHTRCCTGAVAGIREKTTFECRVIPVVTYRFSGPGTSLDALQLRNKTAEGLAPLFRSKNHLSGLHSWFLMCSRGGCTQPNGKGCWSTRDSLSFTKTSDLDFQVLQGIMVLVMDCHIQTF